MNEANLAAASASNMETFLIGTACPNLGVRRLIQNAHQGLTTVMGAVTAWLGREQTNLRMAESKSAETSSQINTHSELSDPFTH